MVTDGPLGRLGCRVQRWPLSPCQTSQNCNVREDVSIQSINVMLRFATYLCCVHANQVQAPNCNVWTCNPTGVWVPSPDPQHSFVRPLTTASSDSTTCEPHGAEYL